MSKIPAKKKYTIKDLQEYARSKDNGDGKCLSKKYVYAKTKYKWQCGTCDTIWFATWVSMHSINSWCPKCGYIKSSITTKLNNGSILPEEYESKLKYAILKHNRKTKYNPELNSIQACKLISCRPVRLKWLKIFCQNKVAFKLIDYKLIYDGIVRIEYLMHKYNIFKKPHVVIATMIYLLTTHTKQEAADLLKTSPISIRTLCKQVGLKKINKDVCLKLCEIR